jgi:membrane-associated phospholipid phosphatase
LLNWAAAEADVIHLKFGQPIANVTSIRAGVTPDFAAHKIVGIVTFPSFHTAAALIYCYAFRHTGVLGRAIWLLNAVMLIAIPFLGNHYLIDVIAGAMIALIAIGVVRAVGEIGAGDRELTRYRPRRLPS